MTRSKSLSGLKHKELLKNAKGYRGRSKNVFRIGIERIEKAMEYQYRDRKKKKLELKKNSIIKINSFCRNKGNISYNKVIYLMRRQKIYLNRFVLSEMVFMDFYAMKSLLYHLQSIDLDSR